MSGKNFTKSDHCYCIAKGDAKQSFFSFSLGGRACVFSLFFRSRVQTLISLMKRSFCIFIVVKEATYGNALLSEECVFREISTPIAAPGDEWPTR